MSAGASGSVALTVTVSNGCGTATGSKSVTISPADGNQQTFSYDRFGNRLTAARAGTAKRASATRNAAEENFLRERS